MFLRIDMVSESAARSEKSWWRNDTKKKTNVHNAQWTSWIFCAKHARGTDELYWQKFGTSRSQWPEQCQPVVASFWLHFEYVNGCVYGSAFNLNYCLYEFHKFYFISVRFVGFPNERKYLTQFGNRCVHCACTLVKVSVTKVHVHIKTATKKSASINSKKKLFFILFRLKFEILQTNTKISASKL